MSVLQSHFFPNYFLTKGRWSQWLPELFSAGYVPSVAISSVNLFSGAQMVGVIVLKTISCMATPPKPPKAKSIPHLCIYTLRKISKVTRIYNITSMFFCIVESSHPKYCLKHFNLPSHDWTGKLEQWPGHWTKETASLKYSNSVIPSAKTNAFLWY